MTSRTILSKLLHVALILWVIVNTVYFYSEWDRLELDNEKLLEIGKCPFCYGFSLCYYIQVKNSKYDFELVDQGLIASTQTFQNLVNVKNVYFVYDRLSRQRAVLKKLAHRTELDLFNNQDRLKLDSQSLIYAKEFKTRLDADLFKQIMSYQNIETFSCPTRRLVDRLYEYYVEKVGRYFTLQNLILLTTLKINPEPIILQMFPQSENWPFPRYYGSCGITVIESYEGMTLDNYIFSSFPIRAKIALKLLQALVDLNSRDFAIYLLDLAVENISYNEENERVFFIDAENVIVVDKKNNPALSSNYYMRFDECGGENTDCLAYSVEKLCSAQNSDINFYSVCRNILSPVAAFKSTKINFLHSMPKEIETEYKLGELLNSCASPKLNETRLEHVLRIIQVLESFDPVNHH